MKNFLLPTATFTIQSHAHNYIPSQSSKGNPPKFASRREDTVVLKDAELYADDVISDGKITIRNVFNFVFYILVVSDCVCDKIVFEELYLGCVC